VYDPPGPESFGDTGLQPYLNPNGISHAIFCYDEFTSPATGNVIVGKVIDPTAGVAAADGTTFSGTIVNDDTEASTPWSGITFGEFTSPIPMPAGVQLTGDEDAPGNGWSEVGWAAGSLDTENNPVCPSDKASYTGHENIGVNLLADQTQVICVMNTKEAPTGPVVTVAKDHTGWNGSTEPFAEGDEFEWVVKVTVSNGPTTQSVVVKDAIDLSLYELVTVSGELGFPSCGATPSGVVSCTLSAPKEDGEYSFRIRVKILDIDLVCPEASNTAGLYLPEASTPFATASDTAEVEECTQVSPTGDLRIEKFLDINGDGDAADVALGEGPIAGWNMTVNGPDENGVFATGAGGFVDFLGLDTGDNYAITEALPAGWTLTNVQVDGANSAVNVAKNVTIPDGGTRVVAFYNQPLGSLNVHKDAVTSHNGGPNVQAASDDDGWTITVVSVACGINQSKQTDASGNASFTGLPLCTDYVVSENPVNAASPGFTPISATSVSSVTPNGQTITFVNRKATFDPPCQDCIEIVPTATPTNTPVPPTATPVPPTATPTPEEATEGERTPGPTPIAPSTGTGSGGGTASMNILLLVAGLAVLSGGLSLTAAGKRRRK
jgi:hypothetical protein